MLRAAFYRGTHAGLSGLYNRAVRRWTRSAYSHVELVFSDGQSASSSYIDGGVRFKQIAYTSSDWDFIDLPPWLEHKARAWFEFHEGDGYDLWGNLHFIVAPVGDDKDRWFCSEAVAAALGFPDPGRYDPGTLFSTLSRLSTLQPASAGF
ncbi:hypothetical protein GJ700_12760 [Duganella sp. FT92W]|uniref:Enoyl-CoA hydratase n=1 Tax=Pseudoduganella rivuli TaxID=2666085 RepID=A0A7X2IMI3_9BURK|nr:hypothetical protein [Pseudoduganella rivuli]MRV72579.1 hypothetical protein [Pseudoduganella rivuli]